MDDDMIDIDDILPSTGMPGVQKRLPKRKRSNRIDKNGKSDPSKSTVNPALCDVVHAKCHIAALDTCYENPKHNQVCSQACLSCHPPAHTTQSISAESMDICCTCGACQPEILISEEGTQKHRKQQVALSIRVTKDLRKIGHTYFQTILGQCR